MLRQNFSPIAVLCIALFCLIALMPPGARADIDPERGQFTYSGTGGIDVALAQIALYLIETNRREGSTYVSEEFETGIVGYQLRFFDNGNRVVDLGDWLSVRRYRIPANPDTTKPAGYYKSDFMEFVDRNLNGIEKDDYYFLNGRRFDLQDQPEAVLRQYQVQIESGISAFLRVVDFQQIIQQLGARGQTEIKKEEAYDDGSLPARIVLGLDMKYVFQPFERNGVTFSESEMVEEIRQRIGFVYSATVEYTDLNGYRFRDLADQVNLMQRTYDEVEKRTLSLILDALFDLNGDGLITQEDISNGYTRFRALHQQLIESARGQNRRIVLPNDKLRTLRQEYQNVHEKPFAPPES